MREVYDRRTLRRMNRLSFQAGIAAYLQDASIKRQDASEFTYGGAANVRVLARKRPLFQHEAAAGEFDTITVTREGVVVHNCLTKANLKTPVLANCFVPVEAFSDAVGNAQVIRAIGLEQMVLVAARGGTAACCMFGQTGSGKTYTMSAVLEAVTGMLFPTAQGGAADSDTGSPERSVQRLQQLLTGCSVHLACYEVCGKSCHDLLHGRARVKVLEDANGSFQVAAQSVQLASSADFWRVMRAAMRERRTCPTARNSGSSRSHAFYHVTLRPKGASTTGSLMFVDLAGSERAADSAGHDAAQQAQSAEINAGISVLKECFRVRRQQTATDHTLHVPYRQSLLTKVLRDALEADPKRAMVVVVGTVSPCASDIEASLNTLRHVCVMAGFDVMSDRELLVDEVVLPIVAPPSLPNERDAVSTSVTPPSGRKQWQQHQTPSSGKAPAVPRPTAPGQLTLPPAAVPATAAPAAKPPVKWTHKELQEWMLNVEGGRYAAAAKQLHTTVDGKALSRMAPLRFKLLCGNDEKRGQRLYELFRDAVRGASDQRAKSARLVASIDRHRAGCCF